MGISGNLFFKYSYDISIPFLKSVLGPTNKLPLSPFDKCE